MMQFILGTRHEELEILNQPPSIMRKQLVLQPPLGLLHSVGLPSQHTIIIVQPPFPHSIQLCQYIFRSPESQVD